MNKAVGLAILAAGAILLYFGYSQYNAPASQISEAVTGSPTDNAVWFLVAGVVAAIIGAAALLRK
jgi:TRAP-type C4-dicarboxylate transport system permease small subunit